MKKFKLTKHARQRLKERDIKVDSELRRKCMELGHQLSGIAIAIKHEGKKLIIDMKDGIPTLVTAWEIKK